MIVTYSCCLKQYTYPAGIHAMRAMRDADERHDADADCKR